MVLRVGLTGGTGAGKSTVSARLAELGAVVIDADALARHVVAPGTPGLAAVVEEFGPHVLGQDGSLDRARLAALVFADQERRRALERITHPLIAERTRSLIAEAPSDAVVVHDVPLLVEKQMGPRYHLVVIVHAAEQVRVARLVGSGRMSEDDAWSRVRAQATDAERRGAADVWLENDGSLDDVRAVVDDLWAHRLLPYEENVRLRRVSRRPEVPTLVAPDPKWPAHAARLAARVSAAADGVGRGVEHIGSTSVPGLPAKDVIDLQLGVTSLEDADRVVGALEDAGFPRFEGEWWDTLHVDARGLGSRGQWGKRLHGCADPARVVHLHVREVGSPGWRFALLFRDWLRAEAAVRDEYAAEKQRLVAETSTTSDYAVAKEPWFERAWERAEAWAEQVSWQPRPSPGPRPPR